MENIRKYFSFFIFFLAAITGLSGDGIFWGWIIAASVINPNTSIWLISKLPNKVTEPQFYTGAFLACMMMFGIFSTGGSYSEDDLVALSKVSLSEFITCESKGGSYYKNECQNKVGVYYAIVGSHSDDGVSMSLRDNCSGSCATSSVDALNLEYAYSEDNKGRCVRVIAEIGAKNFTTPDITVEETVWMESDDSYMARLGGFASVEKYKLSQAGDFENAEEFEMANKIGLSTKAEWDAHQKAVEEELLAVKKLRDEKLLAAEKLRDEKNRPIKEAMQRSKYYGFIHKSVKGINYDTLAGKSCSAIIETLKRTKSTGGDALVTGNYFTVNNNKTIGAIFALEEKYDCAQFMRTQCNLTQKIPVSIDELTMVKPYNLVETWSILPAQDFYNYDRAHEWIITAKSYNYDKSNTPTVNERLLCIEPT